MTELVQELVDSVQMLSSAMMTSTDMVENLLFDKSSLTMEREHLVDEVKDLSRLNEELAEAVERNHDSSLKEQLQEEKAERKRLNQELLAKQEDAINLALENQRLQEVANNLREQLEQTREHYSTHNHK